MKRIQGRIVRRYARALFDLYEPFARDGAKSALSELAEIWSKNPELRNILKNPRIPQKEREELLSTIALKISDDSHIQGLLKVLLDNRRLDALPEVAVSFGKMVDDFKKLLSLEVTSAFPLGEDEKNKLISRIQKAVGAKYGGLTTVNWAVDKKIIGGLLIRSGDTLLDGTVKHSLEKLRSELIA